MKKKAVVILSGGLDSICSCAYLKSKYDLYGISFSYGQHAGREIKTARTFAKILGLKKHKICDISFMKDLYGKSNVLTNNSKKRAKMPATFDYSIVVPVRNAIFLSIAAAWAFTLNASLVAYGAHKDDQNYPDCRPVFSSKMENALNQGEIDGIKSSIRNQIQIWSPFRQGLSKSQLLTKGYQILGKEIFKTWSCYLDKEFHCGKCESCNNRKQAFIKAKITDKTKYMN